jgi:SAM-dependent methyltransferase
MNTEQKQWFESWFDTAYYHALYQHRNDEEARMFIATMVMYLKLQPHQRVLDVACGKGRHSRVLHEHSLKVLGFDLSENSINEANIYSSDELQFKVHDMREPLKESLFDAAFNLFTSFGYFDRSEHDLISLRNIYHSLSDGGHFVQDYLNAEPVLKELPSKGNTEIGGVHYSWTKHFHQGQIIKDIEVKDGEKILNFQEKVKAYSLDELKFLHEQAGFEVQQIFGNYNLDNFEPRTSPRLILISQKK